MECKDLTNWDAGAINVISDQFVVVTEEELQNTQLRITGSITANLLFITEFCSIEVRQFASRFPPQRLDLLDAISSAITR